MDASSLSVTFGYGRARGNGAVVCLNPASRSRTTARCLAIVSVPLQLQRHVRVLTVWMVVSSVFAISALLSGVDMFVSMECHKLFRRDGIDSLNPIHLCLPS